MQRSARNVAMDLLSRREHSRRQLQDKLSQRGFEADEVESALDKLQAENLLSDWRFSETYVHQRMQKGYGPLRIRHELAEKGISSELIDEQMETCAGEWEALMQQQRSRKFGTEIPEDYKEKMKQARFLQNRGFSSEAVMRLFRS
jgi:regulatory protein